MFRLAAFALSLTLWAVVVRPAAALVTMGQSEEFGPAKEVHDKPNDPRYALAYLPGRVYALHKTWSGFDWDRDEMLLAFEGDAAALNTALADFMRLPGAKEIHLLPGPGTVRSVNGKVTRECNWQIRWDSAVPWPVKKNARAVATHTALFTIFIARADKTRPLDPQAAQWIKDLDHERFVERQRASSRLAALEYAAAPLLQAALTPGQSPGGKPAEPPSAERQARIENLLRRLRPIHPVQLRLPAGVAVRSVDELFEREAGRWRSKNLGASWEAAGKIAAMAEFSEQSLPLLAEMLHADQEQVRDLALKALERLGPRAAALAPALRAENDKAAAASAIQQALRAIGANQAIADDGDWRENRRLREGIRSFLEGRAPTES